MAMQVARPSSDFSTLSFHISQGNEDSWNHFFDFDWDLNKTRGVIAEAGLGGSRKNFIASVTYRFW
jgi:hypothetical protein